MAAAIALRSDFTGADLRRLARRTQDAKQARRLLSLATIYDGGSRSDAARIGDVGLQMIRDWVLGFNAAGPDGLVDRKAPGPEPRLNEDHRAALAAAIESGPIPAIHSVVRLHHVESSKPTPGRTIAAGASRMPRAAGARTRSSRPPHRRCRFMFPRLRWDGPYTDDVPSYTAGVRRPCVHVAIRGIITPSILPR